MDTDSISPTIAIPAFGFLVSTVVPMAASVNGAEEATSLITSTAVPYVSSPNPYVLYPAKASSMLDPSENLFCSSSIVGSPVAMSRNILPTPEIKSVTAAPKTDIGLDTKSAIQSGA